MHISLFFPGCLRFGAECSTYIFWFGLVWFDSLRYIEFFWHWIQQEVICKCTYKFTSIKWKFQYLKPSFSFRLVFCLVLVWLCSLLNVSWCHGLQYSMHYSFYNKNTTMKYKGSHSIFVVSCQIVLFKWNLWFNCNGLCNCFSFFSSYTSEIMGSSSNCCCLQCANICRAVCFACIWLRGL